jgi:hypothetical protein
MKNTSKHNVTIRESILIAAGPKYVWDYTQDWNRRAEWDPSIKAAEVLEPGPKLVVRVTGGGGTVFTARYKQYVRPLYTSLTMVDCDPGWMGGGGAWSYEETEHGTVWTQTNTITIKGTWRAWVLGPLFRWVLRWNTKRAMHRAKTLLEAPQRLAVGA